MNCVVQCLSNTRPLLEFCLDTSQRETKAGLSVHKGRLITSTFSVSNSSVISPSLSVDILSVVDKMTSDEH